MKNYFHRNGLLIALTMASVFFCITISPAEAASKRELWSCYDVGASGYIQASSMADALLKKYGITELPALAFFENGELKGKVEGYYEKERKDELKKKVDELT